MCRLAVLVSGNGSNLQALIDSKLTGTIVGVISNNADAYALERAEQAKIPTVVISHQDYPTREEFDQQLHKQLTEWNVDLVVLAGFMRILTPEFVQKWPGRMLNIHPSILPAYKGMNTHQRVLNTGDLWHGCTVHLVTAELDSGLPLAQGVLQVNRNDDVNSLQQRVHELEHLIYPQVIEWMCMGILQYQHDNLMLYHQVPLHYPIQFTNIPSLAEYR